MDNIVFAWQSISRHFFMFLWITQYLNKAVYHTAISITTCSTCLILFFPLSPARIYIFPQCLIDNVAVSHVSFSFIHSFSLCLSTPLFTCFVLFPCQNFQNSFCTQIIGFSSVQKSNIANVMQMKRYIHIGLNLKQLQQTAWLVNCNNAVLSKNRFV